MIKSSGNHFHFLKEPFDMFRYTITELNTENMAKFSKSSAADVLFISKQGKMIFWGLDPVWSPGCLNPRVQSNDVKLIFIFVLFNKYYCVLSKKFVTYLTATQIHLYYM